MIGLVVKLLFRDDLRPFRQDLCQAENVENGGIGNAQEKRFLKKEFFQRLFRNFRTGAGHDQPASVIEQLKGAGDTLCFPGGSVERGTQEDIAVVLLLLKDIFTRLEVRRNDLPAGDLLLVCFAENGSVAVMLDGAQSLKKPGRKRGGGPGEEPFSGAELLPDGTLEFVMFLCGTQHLIHLFFDSFKGVIFLQKGKSSFGDLHPQSVVVHQLFHSPGEIRSTVSYKKMFPVFHIGSLCAAGTCDTGDTVSHGGCDFALGACSVTQGGNGDFGFFKKFPGIPDKACLADMGAMGHMGKLFLLQNILPELFADDGEMARQISLFQQGEDLLHIIFEGVSVGIVGTADEKES